MYTAAAACVQYDRDGADSAVVNDTQPQWQNSNSHMTVVSNEPPMLLAINSLE